jgi:hypothetical protein
MNHESPEMAEISSLLAARRESIASSGQAWNDLLQVEARAFKDVDAAFATWRIARRAHDALMAACEARAKLNRKDCLRPDAADLRAA